MAHKLIQTLVCGLLSATNTFAGPRSNSIAITADGSRLIVVNTDSDSVSVIDTVSQQKLVEIGVGRNPQIVSIDPAGSIAYVTNRDDDTVSILDLSRLEQGCAISVADEPVGVLAANDGLVYVSSYASAAIEIIDPVKRSVVASVATETGPRGLAMSADGSELYVTHFSTGRLSVVNTQSRSVVSVIQTGLDTNLSQGLFLDKTGSRAFLPQTRSNSGNQALLFDTTVFPIVSVVDVQTRQHLAGQRIHLDIVDRPVNLPLDTALVGGAVLYVLNAGSNDLSVIDIANGGPAGHIELGHNPRGMVLSPDEATLYVSNSLSGTVSAISTQTNRITNTISVTEIPLSPSVLNGKRLFNSSSRSDLARDQWISCATCHFDGETDARTWFFPDGPRNTPSLLGVVNTLPLHWSGDLDELHDVEITIRAIQAGTGLATGPENCDPTCDQGPPNAGRSQDLDDLAAFMATLRLPDNPNLGPGGYPNAAARRGEALFGSETLRCSECHAPPLYTDQRKHDVGTGGDPRERKGPAFDVPSLRGIYKTAPYLHDGSAANLRDVLTTRNPDERHAKTLGLSDSEIDDLVAFLQSLSREFEINAGLNGAWFNPATPGQGFFLEVLPDAQRIFMGWFTYDTTNPDEALVARVGHPGHRWLTAQGPYGRSRAELEITLTIGGIFDDPAEVQNSPGGTITLTFQDCRRGNVDYDLPGAGLAGNVPISRLAGDNVALCEALAQDAKSPGNCLASL